MSRNRVVLAVTVILAVGVGGMVFGHEDDEEPVGIVEGAKPRAAPSINDLAGPQTSQKDAGTQQVVRAAKFELTDAQGRARAVLGLTSKDEPSFALADRSGQITARLSIEPVPGDLEGIPVMQLLDKAGTARTDIRLTRDGDPRIKFSNKKGGHLASLSGTGLKDGGTEWLLSDDAGQLRVLLTINHAGTNLTLMDGAKKVRARLGVAPDGTPNLIFSDEAGRQRSVAGVDASPSVTSPAGSGSRKR